MQQITRPPQTALLRQAYKELNESAKRPWLPLTDAQLARRHLLIAHEKGKQPEPINHNQRDLFA